MQDITSYTSYNIADNISAILLTRIGSNDAFPNFGAKLQSAIGLPTTLVDNIIESSIQEALTKNIDGIIINKISITRDNGKVIPEISFTYNGVSGTTTVSV